VSAKSHFRRHWAIGCGRPSWRLRLCIGCADPPSDRHCQSAVLTFLQQH
jgi:hypothetical protein